MILYLDRQKYNVIIFSSELITLNQEDERALNLSIKHHTLETKRDKSYI